MILNKPQNIKSSYKKTFLLYTAIFLLVTLTILVFFIADGRSLVEYSGDGTRQRLRALYFYSDYLKQILRTLVHEGRLVTPNWNFAIGQGADIVGTLQYFAEIGDPIYSLCAFVPQNRLALFYTLVVIFRLYAAGFNFILLCRYKGYLNNAALMSGAFAYVYCNWSLVNIARYPHYLIPLMYFPLVILGVEMIVDDKKPYLMSGVVMLCAMSNFYYFYLTVFFTVAYTILRLVFKYGKDIKKILVTLLKIGTFSGIGVLMGGVIIFPVLYAFTNDARTSVDYMVHAFYPLSYYSALPGKLIGYTGVKIAIGESVFGMLALVLTFMKKREGLIYKIMTIVFIGMAMLPIAGSVMNGFSYSINRWCWAFALLESFLIVKNWDEFIGIDSKKAAKIAGFFLAYAIVCFMLEGSRSQTVFFELILVIGAIALTGMVNNAKLVQAAKLQWIVAAIVLVSVVVNGFTKYGGDGAKDGCEWSYINETFLNNETKAIKSAASINGDDAGLYRYSGQALKYNAGITAGLSSTVYYWSISNPYVVKFRKLMGLNDYYIFRYYDDDNRTILNTLEGVKYIAVNETSESYPYGYSFVESLELMTDVINSYYEKMKKELGVDELSDEQKYPVWISHRSMYDTYKNDYSLPLAYTYDSVMSEETFERLSFVERMEALMQCAIVPERAEGVKEAAFKSEAVEIPYTYETDEELTFDGTHIVTTAPNQTFKLCFDGLADSETYLEFKNFNIKYTPEYDLYYGSEDVDPNNLYNKARWDSLEAVERNKIKRSKLFWSDVDEVKMEFKNSIGHNKEFIFCTPEFDHYTGRHDFMLNTDYSEEPVTEISITFPEAGVYSFDGLKVVCLPMDGYPERVNRLKSDTLTDFIIDGDTITGNMSVDAKKMMCIAIPYAKGWKAYVDGKEAHIYNTNIEYMGLLLEPGEHDFKLVYRTPFLKLGMIISIISVVSFTCGVILYEVYFKRRKVSR